MHEIAWLLGGSFRNLTVPTTHINNLKQGIRKHANQL